MTKIYTKTGDNGRTTLYGGSKVKSAQTASTLMVQ